MLYRSWNTALSIGKVLIKSKLFLTPFKTQDKKLIVIGNGPSAKKVFEQDPSAFEGYEFMAVNMLAAEPVFDRFKPKYYVMADHAFFNFDESHYNNPESHPRTKNNPGYIQTQKQVNRTWDALLSSSHPITLFVPQIYQHTWPVKKAQEKKMNVVIWNYTVFKGFEWVENIMYTKGWASPQCQNVINACIFLAINAGFEETYLTGIDSNFHLNLRVSNDNILHMADDHFYEVEKKIVPLTSADKNGNPAPVRMDQFFKSITKAFYAYHRLRSYADRRNANIYNATHGSFVDAFERKWPNALK